MTWRVVGTDRLELHAVSPLIRVAKIAFEQYFLHKVRLNSLHLDTHSLRNTRSRSTCVSVSTVRISIATTHCYTHQLLHSSLEPLP